METEKKRIEYTNGEIVVVWQPHLCIHSGVCVRMLPEVYNPQERPGGETGKRHDRPDRCAGRKMPFGSVVLS